MRIDRYVHDERMTWGAAGVLMLVTAIHAGGIGRLFVTPPKVTEAELAPVFQVSLEKLPPPRLPPDVRPPPDEAASAPTDTVQRPKQTRPVPILVDTPTTDPVPPDTQVKKYEIGDELLPGEPGPPMPEYGPDMSDSTPIRTTPSETCACAPAARPARAAAKAVAANRLLRIVRLPSGLS